MSRGQAIKLHLGCGNSYKKGYINIDAFDDRVADLIAWAEHLPFEDESVDLIESHHLLEHFTLQEIYQVFEEWQRVLKDGGELIIEIPDLTEYLKIFLSSSYEERWSDKCPDRSRRAQRMIEGKIKTIYGEQHTVGQFHKYGFDSERLTKILAEFGFTDIVIKPILGQEVNLLAKCRKFSATMNKPIPIFPSPKFLLTWLPLKKILQKTKHYLVFFLRYLANFIDDL